MNRSSLPVARCVTWYAAPGYESLLRERKNRLTFPSSIFSIILSISHTLSIAYFVELGTTFRSRFPFIYLVSGIHFEKRLVFLFSTILKRFAIISLNCLSVQLKW